MQIKLYVPLLSVPIHALIILLILSTRDVVHPLLMLQIPPHCFLYALLKLKAGLPAEFALELGGVDGVAKVVAGAVGDVGDEVHVLALLTAEKAVDSVDDDLDDVNVLPFVEAADVVCLGNPAVVEDHVNGAGMVVDVQPVADVLALAVDRKWLAVADIVDEKRDELLRKLIRPVVVRAVRHDGRHAVGVMERADKVVARRFRG